MITYYCQYGSPCSKYQVVGSIWQVSPLSFDELHTTVLGGQEGAGGIKIKTDSAPTWVKQATSKYQIGSLK